MKYYNTIPEEQETTINIFYDEQIIKIYSSKSEVIQKLTEEIGKPTIKHRKSRTYWSGASWEIEFKNIEIIKRMLNKEIFTEYTMPEKKKKKKKQKEEYGQLSMI